MLNLSEIFEIGRSSELKKIVEIDDTVGNFSIYLNQLLSTAACVEVMIRLASEIADTRLPDGYISVGRALEISHEEATLLGTAVTFRVTIVEIDGNRLRYEMVVFDDLGIVCRGRCERVVVNRYALMDRARERAEKLRDM